MTDKKTTRPAGEAPDADGDTGIQRSDQGETSQPGQTPEGPASGGEGAKGAGGPDGFGTGT